MMGLRGRSIGLFAALAAAIVYLVCAAGTATAAELGVCQPSGASKRQGHGHLAYEDRACRTPSPTHQGRYEWYGWPHSKHHNEYTEVGNVPVFNVFAHGTFPLAGGE